MSLLQFPEKEYHDLHDMAERWHAPLADIQYYAAHGHLQIMVWLSQCIVNVYHMKKTEDGETVPVLTYLKTHKGYAILAPDELREIFRRPSKIRRFTSLDGNELLKIPKSQEGYPITIDDLVISHQECARFEQLHTNPCPCKPIDANACRTVSFAGRPSTMHLVRQHFLERRDNGQLSPSLQQESEYLNGWAMQNVKDGQPPKAKTIMNAIRLDYRQHYAVATSQHADAQNPTA